MQSTSVVQLVLQALAPQTNGVQAWVTAAGQLPPLQLAAAVCDPAEQEAARHCAVGYSQAAASAPLQEPWHAPVPSHAQAAWPGCGWFPAVMVAQVPAAAPVFTPLHASHCPVQARSQHLPSGEQTEVWHSFPAVQEPPVAVFATQSPESHQFPAEQAVSRTQLFRQPMPPHAYGAHSVVLAAGQ